MIRVYLAEDSLTTARILQNMLHGFPEILVVGVGRDGAKAMADIPLLKPDVLVTDLWMPKVDGYALIEWVMTQNPLPVLVLSDAVDQEGQAAVVRCLALGALEVQAKPEITCQEDQQRAAQKLVQLIRALSGVRVLRRWNAHSASPSPVLPVHAAVEVVAMGASTGGPQALQVILSRLSRHFPLPILLVQHIEPGFLSGFASWLSGLTMLEIVADTGDMPLRPGCVYLPRENHHLVVGKDRRVHSIPVLSSDLFIPSVNRLFHSVAAEFKEKACGILLTGMGRDGAEGLKTMRNLGAVTWAQDERSCAVYGMPAAAKALDAIERSLDPEQLAAALLELVPVQRLA